MTVNKLTSPISQNDLINKTNEIIDNLGGGGANTDLSNLTATGEAHFQEPLVSGTNIKTINNTSILGSGDISVGGSYSAGTGLSLSGTTFNHTNSVTAGTIGTSSATSGSTISVPYATYDAQGHITSKGTHTHTVTGFLTSSSTEVAFSRFDGQWAQVSSAVQLTTDYTPSSSLYSISLAGHLPSGSSYYDVLLYASLFTKTSSGNSIGCYLGSDLLPITTSTYTKGILLSQVRTRSSSNMASGASCILPVGSYKTIYLYAPANWRDGTINLFMTAYRRIGTNT